MLQTPGHAKQSSHCRHPDGTRSSCRSAARPDLLPRWRSASELKGSRSKRLLLPSLRPDGRRVAAATYGPRRRRRSSASGTSKRRGAGLGPSPAPEKETDGRQRLASSATTSWRASRTEGGVLSFDLRDGRPELFLQALSLGPSGRPGHLAFATHQKYSEPPVTSSGSYSTGARHDTPLPPPRIRRPGSDRDHGRHRGSRRPRAHRAGLRRGAPSLPRPHGRGLRRRFLARWAVACLRGQRQDHPSLAGARRHEDPLHKRSHEEVLATLRSWTNLRAVPDPNPRPAGSSSRALSPDGKPPRW